MTDGTDSYQEMLSSVFMNLISRLRPHAWAFLLFVVFAGISVSYYHKATDGPVQKRSAILRWRPALENLGTGVDIYDRHAFPCPPIMALILKPLAELPPTAMAMTWFWLKAFLTIGSVFLIFRIIETNDRPMPSWAKLLAVG